jgi:hypothetical protein
MNGIRAWSPRGRWRFGLRGLGLMVVAMAVGFAIFRPFLREPLYFIERYARIRLGERDIYRHADTGLIVAERFATLLREGRMEAARELATRDFLRRTGPGSFDSVATTHLLGRSDAKLVLMDLSFSDDEGRFVSECTFDCGPTAGLVVLFLVTEFGVLRVDRIESRR